MKIDWDEAVRIFLGMVAMVIFLGILMLALIGSYTIIPDCRDLTPEQRKTVFCLS